MTVNELMQRKAKVWNEMKNILDTRRGTNGLLSAEDKAVYAKMEDELADIADEIKRIQRLESYDNQMSQHLSIPEIRDPVVTNGGTGRNSDDYKQEFDNYVRGKPYATNSLKVGSDPEGGYLAPDEFDRTLVESLEEENVIRQVATIIRTDSGERKIPVVATKGTASWVEEEALIPESDDSFAQVTLEAYKVATMIKISGELMNDSGGIFITMMRLAITIIPWTRRKYMN